MAAESFKRKLSAILSADVAGYSRLMGEDDDATVRTLTGHREMMSTLIKQHQGRVVDSPGDNLLAEFESILQGVNCAVEIQRELAERNAELSEDRRMEYRIGVNLGDVIKEGDRIYGDGVNIAARLESLAEPGGICISGFVYHQVKNRLKLEYEYLGEHSVKNIKEPVPVYRVLSFPGAAAHRVIEAKKKAEKSWRNKVIIGVSALIVIIAALFVRNLYFRGPSIESASIDKMAYPLPDKPSIAVLPFVSMSEDPKQEFLADGITESIITALSKIPRMFVISRTSTFTYKGKAVDAKTISEALGVRYILEGSIQRSGDRLRITAQLIDAIKGNHLWADRYDRDLKDIFLLQDDITKKVLTELQVKLTEGEHIRLGAKTTDNLQAYLKYLEGDYYFFQQNADDNAMARKLFEEALVIDPDFSSAYVRLAATYIMDIRYGRARSPKENSQKGYNLLQKALELNESNALAYPHLAAFFMMIGEWEKAIKAAERGVFLAPNDDFCLEYLGITLMLSGRPEEAIPHYNKALRLNPLNPRLALILKGAAYRWMEKHEEAIPWLEKDLQIYPNRIITLMNLAACYAALGRMDEAHATVELASKINPKLTVEKFIKGSPHKNPAALERWAELLRKSGMPSEDKPLDTTSGGLDKY